MVLTPKLPSRKNHRLKEYDYGSAGYYYVTLCTKNRDNLLSTIILSDTVGSDALVAPLLTELGSKVSDCWHNIARLNDNIEIDKFVIMPNHIHGIIIIKNNESAENIRKIYGFEIAERRGRRSLQGLMKDFKSVTTRIYKKHFNGEHSLWQDSYFEEIIRNQQHYNSIWKYIDDNPAKWELDKYYK